MLRGDKSFFKNKNFNKNLQKDQPKMKKEIWLMKCTWNIYPEI